MYPVLEFPKLDDLAFADTLPAGLELAEFNDVRSHVNVLMNFDSAPDPLAVIKRSEPALHNQIVDLWGTQQLSDCFSIWLLTGSRSFSAPVASALLRLSEMHSDTFDKVSYTMWDSLR